jgi:hypothetical protein
MRHRFFIQGLSVIAIVGLSCTQDGYSMYRHTAHNYELGTSLSYFKYEEAGMNESGPFLGIDTAYTYRGAIGHMEQGMFRAEARGAYGCVYYDGHLMPSGTPYSVSGIDDMLFEGRILLGRDFTDLWQGIGMTPYLGIAYRHLNDNLEEDVYGYNRSSNYWYCPLGCEISSHTTNGYQMSGRLEYDLFLRGRQKSGGTYTVTNTQKDGYGMRAALRVVRKSGRVDYVLEPFVLYWDIKDSDYVGAAGWYEPDNQTLEYGVRVAMVINTR